MPLGANSFFGFVVNQMQRTVKAVGLTICLLYTSQLHPVKADVIGIVLNVVIGHVEGLFHQLVERLLGIFEEFGVAPPEDGTVAALRGGGQQPLDVYKRQT